MVVLFKNGAVFGFGKIPLGIEDANLDTFFIEIFNGVARQRAGTKGFDEDPLFIDGAVGALGIGGGVKVMGDVLGNLFVTNDGINGDTNNAQ